MTQDSPLPFDPDARVAELGLDLPATLPPVANFVAALRDGDLLYLSGQGPRDATGYRLGKVGQDVTMQDAHDHARLVGLNLLSVIRQELGSLSRVRRVVRVFGMVNATPDFIGHPYVINGCSDLFCEVFGNEVGRHSRSAIGVGSLPGNITVEIEAVIAVAR
jgi:enamine deaminase RidA (YjgF/YER057c/UK114 family)